MRRQDAVAHQPSPRSRAFLSALGIAVTLLALPAAPDASAEQGFSCELKSAAGIAGPDAAAATDIICTALRRQSGAHGSFSLTFGTLGSLVTIHASRGDTGEAVLVRVQGLEEVPVAADRIAESLLTGRAFEKTQRVDSLLEPEARFAPSKRGSVKFMLGVADLESLGHGARGAGFSIGLVYATPTLALPAEMRFGWDSAPYEEKGIGLFSISVGARRYLSRRDVSPFVGGGLGVLNLSARDGSSYTYAVGTFDGDRFGAAAYVEAGIEVLRLHRGRIGLQLRADLPFGSLRSERLEHAGSHGYPPDDYELVSESRYVVPVTIGVNVAF